MKMLKPTSDTCCFCLSLRVGCIVIGYSQLVLGSAAALICLLLVIEHILMMVGPCHAPLELFSDVTFGMEVFYLLLCTSFVVFYVILLVGLHRNKPRLVRAFLVYKELFLVVCFILLVADFVFFPYLANVVIRTIVMTFGTIFLYLIKSFYDKTTAASTETNITTA